MRILIITLLFLCLKSLFSQEPLYTIVKHLNTTCGFPTDMVYQAEFDKNGKSYIASDKGIIIYDGKSPQLLCKQNGLPDNEIYNLKVKDSLLYFLPLKGNVYAFNVYKNNYRYKEIVKTNQVLKYMLIKDSLFYLCTYGHVLVNNKRTGITSMLDFKWNADAYLFNDQLYVKGNSFLLKLNLKTNTVDSIKIDVKRIDALFIDNTIHYSFKNYFFSKDKIHQKPDSFLIIGLEKNAFIKKISNINDSLFFINTSSNTLGILNTKTHTIVNIINNISVNNITYSSINKSFFVCTNNGLYILKKNFKINVRAKTFNQSISTLVVDTNDNFNIGFENGSAYYNHTFYNYTDHKVNCLLSYKHTLFCGLDVSFKLIDTLKHNVYYRFEKNSIKNAVLVDSIVYMTTSKQLLKFNLITYKRDTIIATNHRSYYLAYHQKKLYTQSYTTDSLFGISLIDKKINGLAKLNGQVVKSIEINNLIYFLTDLGYLYIYNKKTMRHIYIPAYLNYPLTNFSVFEYYNNHFIIGNNDASVSVPILDLNKTHFDLNNLHLSFPTNANFIQLKKQNLYYAVDSVIHFFSFNNYLKEKTFYHLNVKQKKISFYRDGIFSKPMGKCDIKLETITYDSQDEELTYYLILANNKVNKYHTKHLEFNIDSLPVGLNYIICFATNNKLDRSNYVAIDIDIKDVSTKSIFITLFLYGTGLCLIFYLFFRYRMNRTKREHVIKIEHLLTEQKASALLMNPHFIFNALANIQGFIGAKQLEKADAYLLQFSLVIRSYLNFMQQGIVPLDQEIESLNHFIEFQKIKYEDALDFKLIKEGSFALGNIAIPAFVIQPFVENSIKFFKNHKSVLVIEVTISNVVNNNYTITIKDNGPGLQKELSKADLLKKQPNETLEFRSLSFTLQRLKKYTI